MQTNMVWYGMSLSHAASLQQAYDTPPRRVVGLVLHLAVCVAGLSHATDKIIQCKAPFR